MINLDHAKILHRDKEGVFIEHGIEGIPNVPISRTYAENIQEWLTDRD
jgi:DNA-binding LytR/AlgR family response regulator